MRYFGALSLALASGAFSVALLGAPLVAQTAPASSAHTASGLEVSGPQLTLRVDALRDDVVRVRMFPNGHPAEDASWAVLPTARTARVKVTATPEGFQTSKLRVSLGADQKLTVSDLAGNVLQQDVLPVQWTEDGFRVFKQKTEDDHFFGLGDKMGPLDRAGEAFTMWNTDMFGFQESTDPIYKSVPFFLEMHGGRTIGVLFDNTFRTFFDFGRERNDRYVFSAPKGPLDYYVMYGPEPKQVVEDYAWLTGPTPLPPLWSLGFQQSRYSYYPQSMVEDVAAHLRRDKIPTDVLWLDIDFQYKNRPFTVDTTQFPDMKGLLTGLEKNGFKTILITDLHIAHVTDGSYAPYTTGHAADAFVKEKGAEYVGPVWPGPAVFPDFTQAASRKWWGTNFKEFLDDGAAGFWNDMNEPAVFRYPSKTMPDDVEHRIGGNEAQGFSTRTAMHPEIHNVYGMENSRATMEGLLTLRPNLRTFVMTRASYAGGQRYAVTWTGDNSSTWNHLRETTPQLLNLGLSGFAMSGADVGGFAGSPSADLLTKWLMVAAFQPIDRDHSAKGTNLHEPWVDGPEHEAIRKRYIEERYKLMPYLYTTAEEMSRTGLPITRPLFLEFPHATTDNHPLDNDGPGEFMFGPKVLVAFSPSPEEVAPYVVHLPSGLWYDYWTGKSIDRRGPMGAADHEIRDAKSELPPILAQPKLDELPVYVKGGSIVPMAPLVQSTSEKPNGPLTLRIFPPAPGEACDGDVYTDDGLTFNFRKGEFFRQHFTCSVTPEGALTVSLQEAEGRYKPWWTELRLEVVGSKAAAATEGSKSLALESTSLGKAVSLKATNKLRTVVLR
ncbi:TIM-barrel domain-containing protein [Granulicella cerasi]|uniref:TIM-barrel domain-containing protein n=1 Tax=Granulicella cerasi TaxID=741063 RepID=A0ABW1Z825_9BACT|nr:TIM-barrel domain-containing protein [Granulicella cerasi]